MRKRWYLLLVLPAAVALLVSQRELRDTKLPATVRSTEQFAAFLDTLAPQLRSRYRVPGVCVGLVEGDLEHRGCYGKARSGDGRPLDGRSRFGVASVSKTFAAMSVLTLAARGSVGLDDPVERHLDSWRFPDGRYQASQVTIRQLLTHTAGVGVASYGGALSTSRAETTRDVLEGRTTGREPVRLIAPPGSGFRYSGGGYMVLQLLVEDVAGMPFERFVTENIFRPLAMRDTSFSWGPGRGTDTTGHDVAGRRLPTYEYGAAMAPGSMVTTADDMLRFVSAFANARVARVLQWPEPLWNDYIAPAQGRYGMGLTIADANGHLVLGHAGTTMGYDAGFTALPGEGTGWFVLANGNGGVFLKPELDRLFLEWKTQSNDPRHRVVKVLRAIVLFLAIVLPAVGGFLLVSLGFAWAAGRRSFAAARGARALAKALRTLRAVLVSAVLVFWLVFFHTDAFYPAFTTAWMPYAFRYVTLGVAIFVLRGVLSSIAPRVGETEGSRLKV